MAKTFLRLLMYSTLLWLAFGKVDIVQAKVLIDEKFDDPLLPNWQVGIQSAQPCMNGSTASKWSTDQGSLNYTIQGVSCITNLVRSDLHLDESLTYSFQFDMRANNSVWSDRSISIKWVNSSSHYSIHNFGNSFVLDKFVNGVYYQLPNNSFQFPLQNNHWHHFLIEVDQEHIRISIDNSEVAHIVDQNPIILASTVGLGIGSGGVTSSSVSFDNVKVVVPDKLPLFSVPYFSQRDPRWGAQEYDRAHVWSLDPTMRRWGCAVTSAAMVLTYFNITTLPNNSTITPETLNAWLLSQPDGYLGNGYVNWLAIARLTSLFKLTHPDHYELEFSRAQFSMDRAKQELEDGKPIITQVPGHFVVAMGMATLTELYVQDPYYADKVILHTLQRKPIDFRIFTPSRTDLSGLVIVPPENIHAKLLFNNQEIPKITEQPLIDQELNTSDQQPLNYFEVLKPEAGVYTLELSSSEEQAVQVPIYSYTSTGELTSSNLEIQTSSYPVQYSLNFTKSEPMTISKVQTSVSDLITVINSLRENGHIQKASTHYLLLNKAKQISRYLDGPYKKAWKRRFNNLMITNSLHVDSVGIQQLTETLSEL